MNRVLGIELRRSAAIGSALILLVTGVAVLFFANQSAFTTGWMQLAMTQRLYLAVLWPLALAAGAWQARREHRSNVAELFASTPRPRAHRTVPTLGAMAVAVVAGYLAMALVGGAWIAGTARYLPAAVFVVAAVGCLALVAAVWLGLALGRLLPSPVTAPALGIAGLGLLLIIPGATRPRGWLALVFSPIYEMNLPGAYATVPGRASAAQAVWLAALAVAAVLLFASGGWRPRVAAILPVVLGASLAITAMPRQNRLVIDAVDPVARELVCARDEPRVCVSRVHSGLLSEVTPPAREGLAVLAKLPQGPTRVHEDTTTYLPTVYPPWQEDVVLLTVEAGSDAHLGDRDAVLAQVVAGAFASPPDCDHFAGPAERLAAAYLLIGREPVAAGPYDPAIIAEAVELWRALRQLPESEVTARLVALRRAALACTVEDGIMSTGTR
ncbi:ABC transporter permease [Paractinoplanes globisporus]|uniref:ABC transporter permease n=1 Tax=Paractinoplanes globisporus TaxID=113565 RepID=A0ABW6W998_9ACTN|nr:ABC transporter permease [Actinoplanes globisporus]